VAASSHAALSDEDCLACHGGRESATSAFGRGISIVSNITTTIRAAPTPTHVPAMGAGISTCR